MDEITREWRQRVFGVPEITRKFQRKIEELSFQQIKELTAKTR